MPTVVVMAPQGRSMASQGFGDRLKLLREAAGLSQQALAERLGVDQASVSRWERNQGEPGVSVIAPLATALGVGVDSLIIPPSETLPPRRRGHKR